MQKIMFATRKTIRWIVPAAVLAAPAAFLAQCWGRALADAAQWIGDGHILTLAAAANALTLVP